MSDVDREKWNARYLNGSYAARTYPSPFLESWLGRMPEALMGRRALDVACGAGRNALCLARAGLRVDGMDISDVALERASRSACEQGLTVNWMAVDMDDAVLDKGAYSVISVIRFMHRALAPRLVDALADDGWLLFEHHLQTRRAVGGPRSLDHRLCSQELLEDFSALRVVRYEECLEADPDGRTMALARLVACNGDPGF